MAKKKAAKKPSEAASSSAAGANAGAASSSSSSQAAAASTASTPSHATLQTALLRCSAMCAACKATLRAEDLHGASDTPLEEVPTHEHILSDVRALLKKLGSTASALALAVKVSEKQSAAEASKSGGTSSLPQAGAGAPLAGLDSGSIAAAQAQVETLTNEILSKLVFISRKCSKEALVKNVLGKAGSKSAHNTADRSKEEEDENIAWGGLGRTFERAMNSAIHEVIDSVDSFLECFMETRTRQALVNAELARYQAAVVHGLAHSRNPPRPASTPAMQDLKPAAQRMRALIRYDALFKLCERLADPSPPLGDVFPIQSYHDWDVSFDSKGPRDGDSSDSAVHADKDQGTNDGSGLGSEMAKLHIAELHSRDFHVNAHARGLPADNWAAMMHAFSDSLEHLEDIQEELRTVRSRPEENGLDGKHLDGSSADKEGDGANDAQSRKDKSRERKEADDAEDDLDEFDFMETYSAAAVERARRMAILIKPVRRALTQVTKLFVVPTSRYRPPSGSESSVRVDLWDDLVTSVEELVERTDILVSDWIHDMDDDPDSDPDSEADGESASMGPGAEDGETKTARRTAKGHEQADEDEASFVHDVKLFAHDVMYIITQASKLAEPTGLRPYLVKLRDEVRDSFITLFGEEHRKDLDNVDWA